jgi:mRNA-degrading endonuclease toxin of MazEF toxin-antitoxin module
MMRGELVTLTLQGDFGKPRPALVIQADAFSEQATVSHHGSTQHRQWPAEAFTGDGGQGHDRQARQIGASLRAH